ncbi:hypothetical protein [Enhygromyxa salina]|uniref:hypothetical protein n=1 Tax=Enhygromyxa salina TaxID=215803 RepID=UPI000D08D87B|nr:hypothetical protein [Enhygromyxa salina]
MDAAFDQLGRLVTGPGLCQITSQFAGETVELDLSYDANGRPIAAQTSFDRPCELEAFEAEEPRMCERVEYQTQRWAWDERGRLTRLDRILNLNFPDGGSMVDADFGCAMDTPLTLEHATWTYDEQGRVTSWSWTDKTCQTTDSGEEHLTYLEGTVEAVERWDVDSQPSQSSTRFDVGACDRVQSAQSTDGSDSVTRYAYDEQGRLIEDSDGGERVRRWTYPTGVAADSKTTQWALERDAGQRLMRLSPAGRGYEEVVIRFDERSRVIALESEYQSWRLSYDSCPNAGLATTRWRVGDLFLSWPFPTPPSAGAGPASLDHWLHAQLPLMSEVLL